MNQFGKILKFELKSYVKNKAFVGITIFLVLVVAAVMFFPRISALFDKGDSSNGQEKLSAMLVKAEDESQSNMFEQVFAEAFTDYSVKSTNESVESIKVKILSGEIDCAFVMNGDAKYTYYVENLTISDMNTTIADEVLQRIYQMNAMVSSGMTSEQVGEVMNVQVSGKVENLGKDQVQNFFYTYIMIFALYMVILLYGQMVSMNVATEKSSRAMEVLITSA